MSGTLPTWLERWLGVEAASLGEGTAWSLENTWSWAPWVTLLACMFAVGWVVFFYARESTVAGRAVKAVLVTLRLALVGIVLFMIAEFTLSLKRTGLPTVAVVLDDSASMGIDDRYDDKKLHALVASRINSIGLEQLSRLNLAKTVLLDKRTDVLAAIERYYRLKIVLCIERHASPVGLAGRVARRRTPAGTPRREQPFGSRLAARAGRSARHAAGGHHLPDRRHQYRRRGAGRRRPLCARARACRCSPSGWAANSRCAIWSLATCWSTRWCLSTTWSTSNTSSPAPVSPARLSKSCCAKKTIRPCWRK